MYGVKADGTLDDAKPIARVWRSGGFGTYYYNLEVPNPSYTGWIKANEFTVPDNGMFIYSTGNILVKTDAHYDYTYTERIDRQFDLIVNKSDLGEIEGYGTNYIMENTITLAGTYNDDTTFNYTIPVIND